MRPMKGLPPMSAWPKCTVCKKPIFDHQYYIPDGMYHDTCERPRDPKINPRIGDILKWNGEYWRIDGRGKRGWAVIWGSRGHLQSLGIAWEKVDWADYFEWAKEADVYYVAPTPPSVEGPSNS